jgi:hypothetical protein
MALTAGKEGQHAEKVPQEARAEYYREFNIYIYNLLNNLRS